MKHLLLLLSSLLFLAVYSSCKHEPLQPYDPGTDIPPNIDVPTNCEDPMNVAIPNNCDPDVSYYSTIELIFNASCGSAVTQCHLTANDDNESTGLADYQAVLAVLQDDFDDDEDPEDFKIVKALFKDDPDERMPKYNADNFPIKVNSAFSSNLSEYLINWIEAGAPNNSCDVNYDTTDVSFSSDVYPLIYWQCIACHNPNNKNGGVCLSDYTNIKYQTGNGNLLVAIDGLILHSMPYNSDLMDPNHRAVIKKWNEEGLKEN